MEMFWQTVTLMTLGMSLVFLFLFFVIQCMNLTAFLIRRQAARHPVAADGAGAAVDAARLAAIAAAALDAADGAADAQP